MLRRAVVRAMSGGLSLFCVISSMQVTTSNPESNQHIWAAAIQSWGISLSAWCLQSL